MFEELSLVDSCQSKMNLKFSSSIISSNRQQISAKFNNYCSRLLLCVPGGLCEKFFLRPSVCFYCLQQNKNPYKNKKTCDSNQGFFIQEYFTYLFPCPCIFPDLCHRIVLFHCHPYFHGLRSYF